MVYASLGLSARQEQIWEEIGLEEGGPPRATRSFLLARHALGRGLDAVVLQSMRPWDGLHACWTAGARVILNHRLRTDSPLGHFSVLAGIDAESALVHDPQFGPYRRLCRHDLLRLWLPTAGSSEIVGHVLVAIAPRTDKSLSQNRTRRRGQAHFAPKTPQNEPVPGGFGIGSQAGRCPVCGTPIAWEVTCDRCGKLVPLRPVAALACGQSSCCARLWKYVFCPVCDLPIGELATGAR